MRLSEDGLAARLQQEAAALSVLYRTQASYGCDPTTGFWLHIERYPLPEGCDPASCPLTLLIPREFPSVPPTTFYLPENVSVSGIRPARFLPVQDADIAERPGWTSCSLPKVAWRKGDDLDRLFSALAAVLHAVVSLQDVADDVSQLLSTHSDDLPPGELPAQAIPN